MRNDDLIRIRHMLDAAKNAIESVQNSTLADLEKNHIWALGLVKCIEIIGEAASKVKEDTREQFPQIPWNQIVAMRNRLIHVYFELDMEQVWKALTEDIPALATELEGILKINPT
jgi:uncharacterized protein with HEPN domain